MKTYVHFLSHPAEFFLQFPLIQELKRRSKHTFYSILHILVQQSTFCLITFFHENWAVYEIMWKNMVERDRPQVTTRCKCFACWITTAEYLICIVSPNDYANAPQCYVRLHCRSV